MYYLIILAFGAALTSNNGWSDAGGVVVTTVSISSREACENAAESVRGWSMPSLGQSRVNVDARCVKQ